MAVLIAVAVSIAAVILSRGGEVAEDLERQNVTFEPSRLRTQELCEEYDFKWDPNLNNTNKAGCREKTSGE